MTDLSKQINLITKNLAEKLEGLENDFQRWNGYKQDYDALEVQLKTLPDTTTRTAMIPMGKLAFMPGKLIHTNEILVLLGDKYYAERSAKQALDVLHRRREVVVENLRLAEAQLNSFRQKKNSIMDIGALQASNPQLNEEGLPIVDIREEVPPPTDNTNNGKSKNDNIAEKTKAEEVATAKTTTNELPESVLRARAMMKEADDQIRQKKNELEHQNNDDKALFDLLRELEEEEEGEDVSDIKEEELASLVSPSSTGNRHQKLKDSESGSESDSEDEYDDDNDDDDDRYDTEIAENMFDRFQDDELYGLDGVVDQEDFTSYEEQLTPHVGSSGGATLTELLNSEEEEDYEKSTPKLITKKKNKDNSNNSQHDIKEEAKEKEENAVETTVKENVTTPTPPLSQKNEEPIPKKLSKFKLAQLEKKESSNPTITTVVKENTETEVLEPKRPKFKPTIPKERTKSIKKPIVVESNKRLDQTEEEEPNVRLQDLEHPSLTTADFYAEPPSSSSARAVNTIPQVTSATTSKPKKVSRFKQAKQQQHSQIENEATITPNEQTSTASTPLKEAHKTQQDHEQDQSAQTKRSVSWGSTTTVREHDQSLAPSSISSASSYDEPMNDHSRPPATIPFTQPIKTPADIFRTIRQTQQSYVDDYPSLDDSDSDKDDTYLNDNTPVDLTELVKAATSRYLPSSSDSGNSQHGLSSATEIYRPIDGTESVLPLPLLRPTRNSSTGLIIASKSKLDTNTMKGAVMERDTEPVDMEEVEEEMDLREVVASYQVKRQAMLVNMGMGISGDVKPEFEVVDEDLPLPKKMGGKEEEVSEEEEKVPRKMSKFKAARMGMRTNEQYEYDE